MAQNGKLLTIGIPTYNRSHYLKECLDHICCQLSDEVQVVVRDNHSDNYDFDNFIRPYYSKYGVVGVKNHINVGGDGNTLKLFEACDTKWLWVIGDDDYILPGTIDLVLKTIKANPKVVYIKYNSIYKGLSKGLNGFAEAMRPRTAFANSFFTSECINNIEETRDYLCWHYLTISTRCPQIIRVMKFLENNPDGKCLFDTTRILEKHGSEITWNYIDIVPFQACIMDYFYESRGILKDNVFRDIVAYCYVFIGISKLSCQQKIRLYLLFVTKVGLVNMIRYNYIQLIRIPLRFILPQKFINAINKYIRQ